ncbi:MAG: hypothetical protein QXT63_06110 [Thermoplasmata archaeon]
MQMLLIFATFLSFVVTAFSMPWLIKNMLRIGMHGKDMNKPNKPIVAEMGGVGVIIGFFSGVFFIMAFERYLGSGITLSQGRLLIACMFALLGAGFVGALDDLFDLRQRVKAILPMFFAIPLALYLPEHFLTLPIIGKIDLGFAFIFVIPFGITCAANASNMLEGFNGLGAGLGIIINVTLMVMCVIEGTLLPMVILLPLLGSSLAFIYYNKYPARIFPGDTLMLFQGAALASAAMLGGIMEIGAVLFSPMIIEFFLKLRGRFKGECFGRVDKNGILHYKGRIESLTHIVMKNMRVNEVKLVLVLWSIEAVLCIGTTAAFFFTH